MKRMLLALAVMVCLALTAVFLFARDREENLASWETYVNVKYNFSFKYPKSLTLFFSEPSESLMRTEDTYGAVGHTAGHLLLSESKNPVAEIVNAGISIAIVKIENDLDPFLPVGIGDIISNQETAIGYDKAVKFTYKNLSFAADGGTSEAVNSEYRVVKNRFLYSIASFGSDQKFFTILDRLIDTFAFLRQEENDNGLQ